MAYDGEPPRRRGLTPLSGEIVTAEEPIDRRQGRVARVAAWRRRREPPRTFAGALLLAAVRLSLAACVASVVAVVVARQLDRPAQIGFYLVGAGILGLAFLFSAAESDRTWWDAPSRAEREYRVSASLVWVLVGAVVLAIGIVLELS